MPKPKDFEAALDEEIDESFPASDPPSSNAGERIGQPERKAGGKGGPKRRRPDRK